ncbi:MAG: hypothetical protein DYG98_13945 [Haliscomenobacteraceae bacterium CHB4]|nr:hypothetical protein [Haliscomenobacteraceae bacterium CHB4]
MDFAYSVPAFRQLQPYSGEGFSGHSFDAHCSDNVSLFLKCSEKVFYPCLVKKISRLTGKKY